MPYVVPFPITTPTFMNRFSVELGSVQTLNPSPDGITPTTITNWVVIPALGDYNQGSGLDLLSGIYTVPTTGLYHIFATVKTHYIPAGGSFSYGPGSDGMDLQLCSLTQPSVPLLSATFFSNTYAGIGGPSNNLNLLTQCTATLAGDLSLTAGNQYVLQVVNPFIDATQVFLENGVFAPGLSGGAFCRWSMRQFA
jgi:hypothetical protein